LVLLIVALVFDAFRTALIFRLVIDWIRALNPNWRPGKFMMVLSGLAYKLTDWVIRPLGRIIRPIRVGSVYLDLSILVLFILLMIFESILSAALR
jgi:YggT family protein